MCAFLIKFSAVLTKEVESTDSIGVWKKCLGANKLEQNIFYHPFGLIARSKLINRIEGTRNEE